MEKGVIISGFPCIGKSTVTNTQNGIIDLESSMLFVDNNRPEHWEKIYINYAEDLAKQGFTVLVSSHDLVRKELNLRNVPFVAIYPDKSLKSEWITRLINRYKQNPSDKNKKAMDYCIEHFDECIDNMETEERRWPLGNPSYDLSNIINYIQVDEIHSSKGNLLKIYAENLSHALNIDC